MTGDLIYVGDLDTASEFIEEVIKEFPKVKYEKTHDYIHQYRVSTEVEVSKKDWLKFIFKNGWGTLSFLTQVALLDKDLIGVLKEAIDEVKRAEESTQ